MNPAPIPVEAKTQRPWAKERDYGPPRNHDTTRGLENCGNLPVLFDQTPDRDLPICRSYWRPTPEEIDALNAGVPVQLVVWGGQVPVDVQVGY